MSFGRSWHARDRLTGLPKKWERILKWERTATVLYVFKSELVDFEGNFGGYLYNYSFVRYVQIVASASERSHPASRSHFFGNPVFMRSLSMCGLYGLRMSMLSRYARDDAYRFFLSILHNTAREIHRVAG